MADHTNQSREVLAVVNTFCAFENEKATIGDVSVNTLRIVSFGSGQSSQFQNLTVWSRDEVA
jgi:hypothetical protein